MTRPAITFMYFLLARWNSWTLSTNPRLLAMNKITISGKMKIKLYRIRYPVPFQ